jgi:23S rRNA (uracil1939-C5)-methyltransferase
MNFFALVTQQKPPSSSFSEKKRKGKRKISSDTEIELQNQFARFASPKATSNTANRKSKKSKLSKNKRKIQSDPNDPSTQYIAHPLRCPMVKQFLTFFRKICSAHSIPTAKTQVGPVTEWRTISKLSVRSPNKQTPLTIGIFAPGSHTVVPLMFSPAHHPSINAAVSITTAAAHKCQIQGYNGKDHGGLSYVGLNVETSTGNISLVLVWNANTSLEVEHLDEFLQELIASTTKKLQWHSIWCHYHKANRHNNQIYGREGSTWECVHGSKDPIAEVLPLHGRSMAPPPALRFPPNVFRQANLNGFTKIIQSIRNRWMRPNEEKCHLCLELYGGVGTIGLNVLDLVDQLRCSDANPFNEACFLQARNELHSSMSKKATYFTKDATRMALDGELHQNVDILIVDPPRKGLDEEVLVEIEKTSVSRPKRIIYVSCGFKAFQKDCSRLIQTGYKPIHAEGHVLFPGANHIETLCVFDDVKNQQKQSSSSSSSNNNNNTMGSISISSTSELKKGRRRRKKKHRKKN